MTDNVADEFVPCSSCGSTKSTVLVDSLPIANDTARQPTLCGYCPACEKKGPLLVFFTGAAKHWDEAKKDAAALWAEAQKGSTV